MKKQLCAIAFSAVFGMAVAIAAPQDGSAPPPPPQDGQQAPHRGPMDPNRQIKMLTKRLNLTSDQQKQILPILTDARQQMQSLRNDSSVEPKDRHEKMMAIRQDSETKIKAVLTDSQKQTYDQMQQQMRERMQQHRDQQGGASEGNNPPQV